MVCLWDPNPVLNAMIYIWAIKKTLCYDIYIPSYSSVNGDSKEKGRP